MQSQRGVTMIEILITLVVTAIGLLGLASMQLINLKNVNNSQYRTQATILAYNMAEMIRSNQAGISGYNDIDGNESEPSPCCANAAEVAARDGYQWNQSIAASAENGGLPANAVGKVKLRAGTAAGTTVYDITISWPEQIRDDSGGQVATKSLTVSLRI